MATYIKKPKKNMFGKVGEVAEKIFGPLPMPMTTAIRPLSMGSLYPLKKNWFRPNQPKTAAEMAEIYKSRELMDQVRPRGYDALGDEGRYGLIIEKALKMAREAEKEDPNMFGKALRFLMGHSID